MKSDLFDQIDQEKKELPKVGKKIKEIEKYPFNFYQKVAILIMIVFFFAGIILGNIFSSCTNGGIYGTTCVATQFNIFLTIITWFIGFLISMFTFWMGHIVYLLSRLNDKSK